jgi:hypothetical protein
VEDEPNPNLPTARQAAIMRVPEARHRASRVNARTAPRYVNTVAMPWVDFGQDRADILAGRCVRDGNRFRVNGREYMLEGGGRLFPIAGDGLYQLGRGAYRALGRYNEGGLTDAVETQLDQLNIRQEERQVARLIWRALQGWRQERG